MFKWISVPYGQFYVVFIQKILKELFHSTGVIIIILRKPEDKH